MMDSRYLEKRTLQRLQESPGQGGHYLLAVSGGSDSIVMLEVLSRIAKALNWQMSVAYVHHGVSSDKAQQKFRDDAQNLVQKSAEQKALPFLTNEGAGCENANTEEAMRNFRYMWFKKFSEKQKANAVLLAHQSQDWLESQLIQMIRGGVKESSDATKLRPLSDWTKAEILFYAKDNQLEWIEDPSNETEHTLRNWLRNEWLPQLEAYRAGSLDAFARSLQLLWSQNSSSQDLFTNQRLWLSSTEVSRLEFLSMKESDQRRVIAAMMNNCGVRNYTQAHIKEVLKRLDTEQNNFIFNTAKATWSVGPVAFKIHS